MSSPTTVNILPPGPGIAGHILVKSSFMKAYFLQKIDRKGKNEFFVAILLVTLDEDKWRCAH